MVPKLTGIKQLVFSSNLYFNFSNLIFIFKKMLIVNRKEIFLIFSFWPIARLVILLLSIKT